MALFLVAQDEDGLGLVAFPTIEGTTTVATHAPPQPPPVARPASLP